MQLSQADNIVIYIAVSKNKSAVITPNVSVSVLLTIFKRFIINS